MPHESKTIERPDDPYIIEFAHEMRGMDRPPQHQNGIPLTHLEIVDEVRSNIAQGYSYSVELDNWGRVMKSRLMDKEDRERERNPPEQPERRSNSLLGDLDAWQRGEVYDPDAEPGK